jgi:Flp pilus assembly pilin Flp
MNGGPAPARFTRFFTGAGHFPKDDSGVTAIEYGLIAAGIALAVVATV